MSNLDQKMIGRLKQAMDKNKINARELAEKANVGRSFVYDVLSGKSSNPTLKKLSAVAEVLGVSVPYLMYGGGGNDAQVFPEGMSSVDMVISIPALMVETTQGGNTLVTDDKEDKPYFFRKSWIEEKLKLKSEQLRIVFVNGDSMEPTLAHGDMMLIDITRRKATPPGVFVIFDGSALLVKRLESISGGSLVRIISDNKKYYSYDTPDKDIDIIGRVVWFAREI